MKRAGIEGLTFHDLRRKAGSQFDEVGLTKAERDLIMGHGTGDMTSLYHVDPKRIQEKLEDHDARTSAASAVVSERREAV